MARATVASPMPSMEDETGLDTTCQEAEESLDRIKRHQVVSSSVFDFAKPFNLRMERAFARALCHLANFCLPAADALALRKGCGPTGF